MVQKLGAYARLLRLSNGPTAIADVWMGYAVVSGTLEPTWPLALATAASLCLYHGGMALNDVSDAEQDKIDNRGRPIAAGQVSLRVATWIARGLLLAGFVLGLATTAAVGYPTALTVSFLLLLAIVTYNSPLKRTLFGPPLMGACRAFNGMLGMAAASTPVIPAVAPGVFAYVAGLTLFARDESLGGRRRQLVLGLAISLAGIGWLAVAWFNPEPPTPKSSPPAWWVLWAMTALFATRGMVAGILQPTPQNIGRGVGIAIQGLVVIDATLATLYAGPVAGLAILALLPVTMLLARWIPQT